MKKCLIAILAFVFPIAVFAQDATNWGSILDFIFKLSPLAGTVITILGMLVVIGTAIDQLIPDSKDGGFMNKLLAIPFLGGLLKGLSKFSPFNYK